MADEIIDPQKPNIGDASNPKLNPPTKGGWNIADRARAAVGKLRSFFGYDIWKEIEGHPWNSQGYKGFQKAREWLAKYVRDRSVHHRRKMLSQGLLYIFDYDKPKYEDTLPWFDSEPLVLSLGTTITKEGPRDVGLNMHLLPPRIRRIVLCKIFNMYKERYKGQLYSRDPKEVQVEWKKIMAPLEQFGAAFAVRMYIPELRKNVIQFRYEDWRNAIFIQSKGLRKITLSQLENEWRVFVTKSGNTRLNESWLKN